MPFVYLIGFLFLQVYTTFSESHPLEAGSVEVDMLKQVYTVRNNVLRKYGPRLEEQSVYARYNAGQIQSVDVSNPLRILVFYEAFNQLVFLDNTLSELRSPLLLDDLGYADVKLACVSSSGGFWLYDAHYRKIIYVDHRLEKKHESPGLDKLIHATLSSGPPDYLMEHSAKVYLYHKSAGLLVFDRYANFEKRMPILQAEDIQVAEPVIFYSRNDSLFQFHSVGLKEEMLFHSPEAGVNDFKVIKNEVYIFDKKKQILFQVYK